MPSEICKSETRERDTWKDTVAYCLADSTVDVKDKEAKPVMLCVLFVGRSADCSFPSWLLSS